MRSRLPSLVRFYLKQRYSRYFLAIYLLIFLAAGVPTALSAPRPTPALQDSLLFDASLLVAIISFPALLQSSFGSFFRAEVDVMMTTQADPVEVLAAKMAGDSLFYVVMLAAYTASYSVRFNPSPLGLAEYVVSLLAAAGLLSLLGGLAYPVSLKVRMASASAMAAYLLATSFLAPQLNPLYGLVAPSPVYAAALVAIVALLFFTFPRRAALELYTNAYGILGSARGFSGGQRELVVKGAGLPRTTWRVIWHTSTRSATFSAGMGGPSGRSYTMRRTDILKIALPISTGLAIAVSALIALGIGGPSGATSAIVLSSFGLFYVISVGMSVTLQTERIWIDFSGDSLAYMRYRMLARALLAYLVLAPWIASYGFLWYMGHPAASIAAVAAMAAPLLTSPLGWIIGAFWGIPQVRELGMVQRPTTFSLRYMASGMLTLLLMGIVLAPVALAAAAGSLPPSLSALIWSSAAAYSLAMLAASSVFFAASLLTGWGRGLWDWMRDRLVEQGYV